MEAGGLCLPQKELSTQEKVTAEWDAMAGEWDDMAAPYARAFYQRLASTRNNTAGLVVVDFGCGTGLLTALLQPNVLQVVGVDVSTKMVEVLRDKIQSKAWTNVQAVAAVLGKLEEAPSDVRELIESLYGKVDLIVASSVLTFVPDQDMESTCRVLGRLLKDSMGLLVHSDWPKSEAKHPDAMTEEKAVQIYTAAGLKAETMEVFAMDMGDSQTVDVFWGVAKKE